VAPGKDIVDVSWWPRTKSMQDVAEVRFGEVPFILGQIHEIDGCDRMVGNICRKLFRTIF
jgi:hypothetical protein